MRNKVLVIILILCIFSITKVDASVTTYPRDKDNLGVSDDIKVTSENLPFILNTPKIDVNAKVYDFADLFETYELSALSALINQYTSLTSYDIAIVTINDNPKSTWQGKTPTETYAHDFYNYNDFKENGVLFLIDKAKEEIYIYTSSEASLMYNEERLNVILKAIEQDIKNEDYYFGTAMLISKLKNYYIEGIPDNSEQKVNNDGKFICYDKVPYLSVALISIVITTVIIIFVITSYKKIRLSQNAEKYIIKDRTQITARKDNFIKTKTTKVQVSRRRLIFKDDEF